jgi:pectate lyase
VTGAELGVRGRSVAQPPINRSTVVKWLASITDTTIDRQIGRTYRPPLHHHDAAPGRHPGDRPVGWASVNADGQNGTTGGAAGATVTVSDPATFAQLAASDGPLTIRVQ